MAITEAMLLYLGVLAAATSWLGVFRRFGDRWTGTLVTFVGTMLWGLVGISAFDVITVSSGVVVSTTSMQFVLVGFGFAALTGLVVLHDIVVGGAEAATAARGELIE